MITGVIKNKVDTIRTDIRVNSTVGGTALKRTLSFVLSALLLLLLLLPHSAAAEESATAGDRPVLTIGDNYDRSGSRYNSELGLWQYLADLAGVEIRYVYLSSEDYASGLAGGNLPDIVATNKNLPTILENGVALDADPYLEEFCPNLLRGDARQTYDVFKQLGNEGQTVR